VAARIQLPKDIRRGEVVNVQILVQHPMESGYRLDADNRKVPKNAIRSFLCRYNGEEVFRAEMSPGIAANPFLQFPTVARDSGELEFTWVDDAGERGEAKAAISVS
jgi:sulfur-oxidizing protein SoxZ